MGTITPFQMVFIKTLTLSEDERRRVESTTQEQNQCKEWYESQKHRLNVSNFGKLHTNSKPEGSVKQILYPQDISHIPGQGNGNNSSEYVY